METIPVLMEESDKKKSTIKKKKHLILIVLRWKWDIEVINIWG